MDEDSARIMTLSNSFAETILRAYKLRFPTKTKDSQTITINSLLIATLGFLDTLDKEPRDYAIDCIINAIVEYKNAK